MHTLNIAPDVEYGHKLPPPFNIRPQLPCHEPDESLKPSDDISFMFFARRRILYPYVAKSLEMLAPDVNRPGPKCRKMRAHSAMLALAGWRPASGQVPYERIPQMDEGARLAGLLYYRLVYAGGRHDQTTESMAMRLKEECLLLRNEQHLFSQLYRGCSNRLCLILWILYCGGSFATGELRAWYAEHVKLIAGGTGKDWTRTKDILRRFVWDDKACEGPMKQLWRESLMQEWMGTDDQVRAPRAVGEA